MTYRTLADYREASCAIFGRPVADVRSAIRGVFSQLREGPTLLERDGPVDLGSVRSQAEFANEPERSMVFAPTPSPQVTVLFTSMRDGWITLVHRLSWDLRCRAWFFKLSTPEIEDPVLAYHVVENGEAVRVVRLAKDHNRRWEFYQRGARLDGEDDECVSVAGKPKKRRLDHATLLATAERFGFPLHSPEFWTSDAPAFHFHRVYGQPSETL